MGRFFFALVFVFLVAVRFLHLSADPPLFFPNGFRAYEPFTDEAAKAYQARNRALFGKWNTSEQDQYRFWKVLSPVWCYSLFGWFKIFGVSYPSLRGFSLFWFGVGLVLIYLTFAKNSLKNAGLSAGLFYALNFYLFLYSRLGLMETMLNSFLLMTFMLLVLSVRQNWFFPFSLLVFLASYFIKQNALLLFPVFLVGYFFVFGNPLKKKFYKEPANWLSIILVILILALLDYLWHQPDYRLFTVMNLRHGYGLPPDPSRMGLVLRPDFIRDSIFYHFSRTGFWQTFFAFDPIVSSLVVLELIFILALWLRREKSEPIEILALVWLLSLRIFLAGSSARVERFWMPQIPAMVILAGVSLSRISDFWEKKFLPGKGLLISLIFALSFAWNFYFWFKWFSHPRYETVNASKKLELALGNKPAVVIGKWAGPLLLPSQHQYYYVKNIFNRSPEQLKSFGITHLLLGEVPLLVREEFELAQDPYRLSFEKAFSAIFARKRLITEIPFYDGRLELYEVNP